MAAMPGTLAEEVDKIEPFGLFTLSAIPLSVMGHLGSEARPGLTYSQVASRNPSPESSTQVRAALASATPVEASFNDTGIYTKSEGAFESETSRELTDDEYQSQEGGPEDSQYPWTQVMYHRRRSKSLPASEEGKTPYFPRKLPVITPEQYNVFRQAENRLTPSEKSRIEKR